MQPKKLIILLAVAAALCIAAVMTYKAQNRPYQPGAVAGKGLPAGSEIFPDLGEKRPKIARVEIAKAGERIALARVEGTADWRVESAGGYPADSAKIGKLVFGLMDVKVSDRSGAQPTSYGNFGLTSGTIAGSVRLAGSDGAALAEVTWGREAKAPQQNEDPMSMPRGGPGRYLLRGGDPIVYLAKDSLELCDTNVASWVDPVIVSVPADKIVAVRIDHNSTETLTLSYEENKLKLDKIEPGMKAKDYEVTGLGRALDGLRLSGVLPAAGEKARDLDFATPCDLTSKDGTIYRVATVAEPGKSETDKKWYLRLSATYGAPMFTAADQATTTSLAAAEKAAKDAEAAVPAFNEKHSPWVYQVDSYAATRFTKKRSELMEKIPEPPKTEEPKSGAPTSTTPPAARPAVKPAAKPASK